MALRSGYKGFKKLINGLKVLRPGVLGIDIGTGLAIGQDGKLNVTGVEVVVAGNPEEAATAGDLTKLQIGDDIFNVPDTTYSNATTTEAGLMSAADKEKLDGLDGDDYFLKSEQEVAGAVNVLNVTAGTASDNNITFTVNADKSITVQTTAEGASATTFFPLEEYAKKSGKWYITGCPENGGMDSYALQIRSQAQSSKAQETGSGAWVEYTSGDTTKYALGIRIQSGQIITDPITFYPMIAVGEWFNFIPYAMTNSELTRLKLDKLPIEVNGISVDTLTDAGIFYCNGNMTGLPYGTIGLMLVFKSPVYTGVQQIYIPAGDVSKVYIRRFWENAWGNWYYYEGTQIQP